MKFKNFTLLKLTICYCIGILLAHFLVLPQYSLVLVFGLCFFLLITSLLYFKKSLKEHTGIFSVLAFISILLLGALSFNNTLTENQNKHYSHFLKANNTYVLKIEKRLKSNPFYHKYYADVILTNNKPSQGRILIQQKRDSLTLFKPDDSFVSNANIIPVKNILNPHQFDYKRYLRHQGVLYQSYLNYTNYKALTDNYKTYNGWNYKLIERINSGLKAHHIGKNELAIINALLLGQKQDISNNLYKTYTNSGVIHILAVSGLHVSIILIILQFALSPLFNFKKGSYYKIVIIVIVLWAFAFLTGGSASVIRATTMFTLITITINLKRKTTIYNTLIASAFIILLFKPQFIFDVGFQLSYSAVFSIVAFQPLIARLWKTNNKVLRFIWNTFSVTLAAQFGILPISLFYFHQFPGLFWLSNLVIIPFLPLILGLGILCILCILLETPFKITAVFVWVLERILFSMNYFLNWISNQEAFIFRDLYFNLLLTITSLFLVACIYRIWHQFTARHLVLLCIAIISLQLSFIYTNHSTNYNELVVFHKTKATYIGIKQDQELHFYTNDVKENYITKSYKVGSNVKTVTQDSLMPFFNLKNKRIMIIDSTAIYDLKGFKPDVILLTQSPKLNLERLIKTLQPKKIIADGSNYKSYIKRWEETCKHKKGLFHKTEKGAFTYRF